MTITVGGTAITFNDGTTQTTAGGAVNTSTVLSATAGASVGAVGTYAFLFRNDGNAFTAGTTYAASVLRYAGVYSTAGSCYQFANVWTAGAAPSGTWRAMGSVSSQAYGSAVFLRIS
jgi:hypothetical protein